MSDAPQQSQNQEPKQVSSWFKPGQSGNPAGKPKGSRNRLQGDFMRRLADDFERYGIYAIARARHMDPLGYVKVCASLMPKEVELKQPLGDITDEQLDAALIAVRAILAAQGTGDGAAQPGPAKPAEALQPVPEAG